MYASITRCAKYLPKKSNYHFCVVNKDTQVWLPNSFAWDHTAYQRWNSTQAFCIPGLYLNAYPLQMEEKDEWLWIEIFFFSQLRGYGFWNMQGCPALSFILKCILKTKQGLNENIFPIGNKKLLEVYTSKSLSFCSRGRRRDEKDGECGFTVYVVWAGQWNLEKMTDCCLLKVLSCVKGKFV